MIKILDRTGIESVSEFDRQFQGTQSLFNWIQDFETELWNMGRKAPQFLAARIEVCETALRRLRLDGLVEQNFRRAIAGSYFELGETGKAEALFREWLTADRRWGWGWIGWADCYWFSHAKSRDLSRAEKILREGLSIDDVTEREHIFDRLAAIADEQGRGAEARDFRRLAKESRYTTNAEREGGARGSRADKSKTGRNEPCPCGSGRKYKKCCGGN